MTSATISDIKGANDVTKKLSVSGANNIKAFLSWIYGDATIFLKRKHKRYIEILNTFTGIRRDSRTNKQISCNR